MPVAIFSFVSAGLPEGTNGQIMGNKDNNGRKRRIWDWKGNL